MSILITSVVGQQLADFLDDVARLRIEVFREWPYLYDGDLEYERTYLAKFATSPDAVIVLARDGETVVGASTASPLASHFNDFGEPFRNANLAIDELFYFGESVLLPRYRGQGIGVQFFEQREKKAVERGFQRAVFCGVVRPVDHPRRPEKYEPLDSFWRRRGFRPLPGIVATFPWKEVGEESEREHPMQFWIKELASFER